jgi:hypothetical protein
MPSHSEAPVSEAVLHAAIAKLGLGVTVPHTLEGLQGVFVAWCRGTGSDSVGLALRSVPEFFIAMTGFPAENYFKRWLAFGLSDLCLANAEALLALLRYYGFAAERVLGSMGSNARHGSVVVRIDGENYLVDPTFLAEQPLLLRQGEPTSAGAGPLRIWAGGDGTVKWQMPQGRFNATFKIEETGCDFQAFLEFEDEVVPGVVHPRGRMYKLARMYKDRLFIRRNVDGGIRTYDNGTIVVKAGRQLTVSKVCREEFPERLTKEFGIAAEAVRMIPASYFPDASRNAADEEPAPAWNGGQS